jgi:signal transduction histidine kinase
MSLVLLTGPASVMPAGSALRDGTLRLVAPGLGDRVIVEFAAADDVRSGMARVVAMLRRGGGAGRVEWWSPADGDSSLRLEVAVGHGRGRRVAVPVGPAGVVVLVGADHGPQLRAAVRRLASVLRRRWTEERLAQQAVRLARRNQALGDFAALVAHELKTPLELACLQDDPSVGVERALELVDMLLETAQAEAAPQGCASAADCLDEALRDLGPIAAEVTTDLAQEVSLPAMTLRVLLRNLVANAVAAGARHIHVATVASAGSWRLTVDDDGVGLGEVGGMCRAAGWVCACAAGWSAGSAARWSSRPVRWAARAPAWWLTGAGNDQRADRRRPRAVPGRPAEPAGAGAGHHLGR